MMICVRYNEVVYGLETKISRRQEPIHFFKSSPPLGGGCDNVVLSHELSDAEWEVELAVVIGRTAKNIDERIALSYVAGYAVHNDFSKHPSRQSDLSSHDFHWPNRLSQLGPLLVTADEVSNPDDLRVWLNVNNRTVKTSTTADMLFSVSYLISYLSRFVTLQAGNIISLTLPSGLGGILESHQYVKTGDFIELGIQGLGVQRKEVLTNQNQFKSTLL
ncbi:fumarylacetoacetate hydrolase family protein [Chryseolinea lacunae]|uniref:Fumarylacetoacetate hydrolase family protein n=1 Tax=Chryseolinea lacunae TaxID=2801331 RepID=A0ABS1L2U1_9BACT|nr:fumarylacetoacetate hydrolase family protein [Chryseolinea lacunae]MBL0745768.1 fumarylacetoacetate hydrolase family protein [Chryseolinea lacunae]